MALNENIILSQLIKNDAFRDKVIPHVKNTFFQDADIDDLFRVIDRLVKKEKVKKLDRATILIEFPKADVLDRILATEFPIENTNYLLKETEFWAKDQALKEALLKGAEILHETENMDPEKAVSERAVIGQFVREALTFSFDKNLGLNYKKDIERRWTFYNRIDEKIATGWDMLDMYTNGGLQKKTLTVSMGSTGLGKTLLGTNLTASLISRGYKGVYLTMELLEDLIGRRIDSVLTKIPYYSLPREEDKARQLIEQIRGNVWVREYPPSRACAQNILNYIRELQDTEKVTFDFAVVDYIQLCKPNFQRVMNSNEKYKEVSEELREIGLELDIPIIAFSQVHRAGYNNSDLGLSNVADSIGIVNTADLVIGMTQSPDELPEGMQTWKIVKNRLGKKGVSFRIQQDDEILAFNSIINEEERMKLTDFQERMKKSPNMQVVKEDHVVTIEEEVNDFMKYAEEIDSPIGKLQGFS